MSSIAKDILALSLVPGLGTKSLLKLIDEVPDLSSVFVLSSKRIEEIIGKTSLTCEDFKKVRTSKEFKKEIEYLEQKKIKIITIKDEVYPESLRNIYDPPVVLFCKGNINYLNRDAVAVIGSRRCTSYGRQMAEEISFDLSKEGIIVVSGMARGIDSSAHKGAIKSDGGTVAVMGAGFKHIYPPEAKDLFEEITEKGLVVTEYTSRMQPTKWSFPKRNRIISGLSKGVVVIEAAAKSGAMITVDFALEQGREVFAVPGRADSTSSEGTNFLIRTGAKLVAKSSDIVEELNLNAKHIANL